MPDSQVSVSLVEGRPATTSLKIAECFAKQHKHVIRDIEMLLADIPEDFHKSNFGLMFRKVKIGNGAEREEPYYIVYFDGFMLLVMGYTGKKALAMKLAYIGAFNAMREKLENRAATELPSGVDAPLTPDQQCTLRAIVKAKVEAIPEAERSKGIYPQIWSRFNNHFRIAKYCQLPQSRLSEAIDYLVRMGIREEKALPQQQALPPTGDKFVAYIEKVEAFRQKTAVGIDALVREGLHLVDVRKFGPGCMSPFASTLVDWLQKVTVSVSPIISSFHTPERVLDYCPIGIFREMENDYEWCRGKAK